MHLRSRLHERAALAQAKVIAYFFDGRWGKFGLFTKSAMLLQWWPFLLEHMKTAAPATCWKIPAVWNTTDLRNVSTDPAKISEEKAGRSGSIPAVHHDRH